jgi:hypothetical protein
MALNDWADDAWSEFETSIELAEYAAVTIGLAKAAWLHGARAGVAKAQEVLAESMPEAVPADPVETCESFVMDAEYSEICGRCGESSLAHVPR